MGLSHKSDLRTKLSDFPNVLIFVSTTELEVTSKNNTADKEIRRNFLPATFDKDLYNAAVSEGVGYKMNTG